MKLIVGLLVLVVIMIAWSFSGNSAKDRAPKDWTPLVGDKRVIKDGMVGCVSLDSYKTLMKHANEGSDAGIRVLLGNRLCYDMGGQKVQVVELDMISNGAIVVKPLEGELKGKRIWTLEKATSPG